MKENTSSTIRSMTPFFGGFSFGLVFGQVNGRTHDGNLALAAGAVAAAAVVAAIMIALYLLQDRR
jgi:hypothetical protein